MENNDFQCVQLLSRAFHEFAHKTPYNQKFLLDACTTSEMMLLLPRPFVYLLKKELKQLSALNHDQQSFMVSSLSLLYPIHNSTMTESGIPFWRINSVAVFPSPEMVIHLFHASTTERLDNDLRVSIPLMPGYEMPQFPGVNAVMFKIQELTSGDLSKFHLN